MPHSIGGSSHSGGSHSSSHSSHSSHSSGGSGGSGSSKRTSSQPFAGSKRYLYYEGSKPYFVYSNYDIRKRTDGNIFVWIIEFMFILLPFILTFSALAIKQINVPKKVDYFKNRSVEYVIEDNAGVIKDEKKLKKSLKEFYKETGVVPAVITVNNDAWNTNYKNLEKYAFDLYVNRFKDEYHLLIVYSEAVKDDGFNDWYCEEMAGDNTGRVITDRIGSDFNNALYKNLLQREKYSVDEAIAATFDEYTPKMMKVSLNNPFLFFGFLFVVMLLLAGSAMTLLYALHKDKVPEKYKKAVPCDLNAVYQGSCNFCGGLYIVGMHTECPHCGAALPPQNYVQDPQGNVIQIFSTQPPKT